MKTILMLIGLALCAGITHAQTTNAAPVVTQPTLTTVIKPAIPASTTSVCKIGKAVVPASVALPDGAVLAAAGLVVPAGAVSRVVIVAHFSDGSSRVTDVICPVGKLPAPPATK